MAEDWRRRLKRVLKERDIDMKEASLGAGLSHSFVSQLIAGNDSQISNVIKLFNHLKLSFDEILADAVPIRATPKTAPVIGETAAGQWLEPDSWDEAKYPPVPFVQERRYTHLEQRAYRVIGPSMNLRGILDGAYVITVKFSDVRTQAQDGDIVIVERHRDGGLIERTIKEVVILPDRIELTPRSTDERFKDPLIIPRNLEPHDESDPLQIDIVALVIGSYTPVGRN